MHVNDESGKLNEVFYRFMTDERVYRYRFIESETYEKKPGVFDSVQRELPRYRLFWRVVSQSAEGNNVCPIKIWNKLDSIIKGENMRIRRIHVNDLPDHLKPFVRHQK